MNTTPERSQSHRDPSDGTRVPRHDPLNAIADLEPRMTIPADEALRLAREGYQQGRVDVHETLIELFTDHHDALKFNETDAARVVVVLRHSLAEIQRNKP